MKIFLSHPMRGLTDEEILKMREDLTRIAVASYGKCDIINSFISDMDGQITPVKCLVRSLNMMTDADMVIFHPDWRTAKGCRIEHDICHMYDIPFFEV